MKTERLHGNRHVARRPGRKTLPSRIRVNTLYNNTPADYGTLYRSCHCVGVGVEGVVIVDIRTIMTRYFSPQTQPSGRTSIRGSGTSGSLFPVRPLATHNCDGECIITIRSIPTRVISVYARSSATWWYFSDIAKWWHLDAGHRVAKKISGVIILLFFYSNHTVQCYGWFMISKKKLSFLRQKFLIKNYV